LSQGTPDDVLDRRMALVREWGELVEQVRDLEGFEDSLGAPRPGSLLPAAEKGPVVVNVSRWRCDALIVEPDGVTSCWLEDLTLEEAARRTRDYLDVLHAVELADREFAAATSAENTPDRASIRREHLAAREVDRAQATVDELLVDLQAWLWNVIADPVLRKLDLVRTPADETVGWPRLWWCPTGPLTLLPLHAAGYHRTASADDVPRTVIDCVVSSYTPTMRALLEARRPSSVPIRL
jgi:hypothetical protein